MDPKWPCPYPYLYPYPYPKVVAMVAFTAAATVLSVRKKGSRVLICRLPIGATYRGGLGCEVVISGTRSKITGAARKMVYPVPHG